MPSKLSTITVVCGCLVGGALSTLESGCAPDSSVGADSVLAGSGGASAGAAAGGAAGTLASAGGAAAGAAASAGLQESAGATAVAGASGSVGTGGGAGGGVGGTAGGGTAGGGTVGTAGAGGASLCPSTGATLCDGFENAAPGATGSDWTVSGSTISVDATKAYRGTKSVKFSATLSAFIVTKKPFTGSTKATNNSHWGRYFILSNVAAAIDYSQSHVVFGSLAGATNAGDQFNFVGGTRGKLQAEIRLNNADSYTDSSTAPAASDPSYPLVADGWQCWEWQVMPDDSFAFYIDGKEVTEMKVTAGKAVMSKKNFAPMPSFASLSLGWQVFSAGKAISGWVDEVAVGPTRIGCGS